MDTANTLAPMLRNLCSSVTRALLAVSTGVSVDVSTSASNCVSTGARHACTPSSVLIICRSCAATGLRLPM